MGIATGGNATFTVSGESFLGFVDSATANHAVATCIGGDQFYPAGIFFFGFASADEGTFTAVGGSSNGEKGSYIELDGSATAASGTFVIGGGLGAGLAATTLTFYYIATAAAANITANGGVDGSDGGAISFTSKSKGGTCSITLSGNAVLDMSTHNAPGVTMARRAARVRSYSGRIRLLSGATTRARPFPA